MTFSLKTIGLATAITVLTAGSALAAVSTTSLNVRSGPGINYGVVATLAPGEQVSIRAQSNGWCELSSPGGWASCAYLSGGPAVTYPNLAYGYGDFDNGPDFDYGPTINIGPSFPIFPSHHFNHSFPHHRGMNDWWLHHHHK